MTNPKRQAVNIAIDIGGTFTDFVVEYDDGKLESFKLLSHPNQLELPVIEGLTRIGHPKGAILHATTIAANVLLGQVGLELPRVALLSTKGFSDVIEIGRQNRPTLYDLTFEKPKSLVPKELRFEIDERVDSTKNLLKPINRQELELLAKTLWEKYRVDSVALSFLHSYANPINEKTAKEIFSDTFRYVTSSHEIAPEHREYERTSTTVLNAVLMPILTKYLRSLRDELEEFGSPPLLIMSGSGGLISPDEASTRSVQLIGSGPAAGVIAAAELAKILEVQKVISFDMGGTTAKASTVLNYRPEIITEYEACGRSQNGRIINGSGYPIQSSFIDLAEVSAGGGTVIWKDEASALKIGPISVGATPGPMCYGKGGTEPAITDANIALGRIAENLQLSGITLDKEAAIRGLSKLGDPTEIARSAIDLANLEMARAMNLVTIERGIDPFEFTLMAFGGAGPQHAAELADEMGISIVMIPPEPGSFSSLGMLLADSKIEARSSFPTDLENDFKILESKLSQQIASNAIFIRYADVRYQGQGWELLVPVDKPTTLDVITSAFEKKHQVVYGFQLDLAIEVVTIRVFAIFPRKKPHLKMPSMAGEAKARSERMVFFNEWLETPIYWRSDLQVDFTAQGPLIVEEYGSTILVPPEWKVSVADIGVVVMEK